jgi:hypothetical protein
VELALRPTISAPREQRQLKREQRAEATDSEAHGIAAGPVFSFEECLYREGNGSRALAGAHATFTGGGKG